MKLKKVIKIVPIIAIVLTVVGCKKHEHSFVDASCEKAKTCEECGYVEGEPLGHNYSAATCDKAKTCKECGEKEGTSLGHTTTLGNCTRCKVYQGEATLRKFYNYGNTALEEWNDGVDYVLIYASTDKQAGMTYSKPYFEDAKREFQNLYDLCSDEPQLKSACRTLNSIINSMPTSNNIDTFYTEFFEVADYLEAWLDEYENLSERIAP